MIARRYKLTNLPKSNAYTQDFSARALNERPYIQILSS